MFWTQCITITSWKSDQAVINNAANKHFGASASLLSGHQFHSVASASLHKFVRKFILFGSVTRPSVKIHFLLIFIGPESDHWECLVNVIDATLACEDAYSKLVKVVTVSDVSDEDCVGNSLLQIWKPRFGHNPQLLFRLWALLSRFWSWSLVSILLLMFGWGYEVESWSRLWS